MTTSLNETDAEQAALSRLYADFAAAHLAPL